MEKGTSMGMIISSIVVVAALVGGGIYLANRDSNGQNSASTTPQSSQQQNQEKTNTIIDAASANRDFSTLVSAVKAADLVGTLSGSNKLTVFAPTNSAFEKLPAGTLDSLLQAENKETLKNILTYHVVEGEVLSSQLQNGQKVKTVNGGELTVALEGGMAYLVDAKGSRSMVTQADVRVDNGVIHAIDSVLMPQ